MHGVFAHTEFPRTLTMTNYLSVLFSTLSSILPVTNLCRLECAETQCARKPRAYDSAVVRNLCESLLEFKLNICDWQWNEKILLRREMSFIAQRHRCLEPASFTSSETPAFCEIAMWTAWGIVRRKHGSSIYACWLLIACIEADNSRSLSTESFNCACQRFWLVKTHVIVADRLLDRPVADVIHRRSFNSVSGVESWYNEHRTSACWSPGKRSRNNRLKAISCFDYFVMWLDHPNPAAG